MQVIVVLLNSLNNYMQSIHSAEMEHMYMAKENGQYNVQGLHCERSGFLQEKTRAPVPSSGVVILHRQSRAHFLLFELLVAVLNWWKIPIQARCGLVVRSCVFVEKHQ